MEPVSLTPQVGWQQVMAFAVKLYLEQTALKYKTIDESHIKDTPGRVVQALLHYSEGCSQTPNSVLSKRFASGKYNEMIHVEDINLVSSCAHHLERIIGKCHFSYVPDKEIVGLSKISRLVDIFASRPQVQENLTEQIVDAFQEIVKPKGCALHIKAFHFCMLARGVEEPCSKTSTTAFRGCFETGESREEFLLSINRDGQVFP